METNVAFGLVFALVATGSLALDVEAASDGAAIRHEKVRSSTIESAGYSREARVLEVKFHTGAIYRYRSFPEPLFNEFMASTSKGRFFGREIRGKFPYEKMKERKR